MLVHDDTNVMTCAQRRVDRYLVAGCYRLGSNSSTSQRVAETVEPLITQCSATVGEFDFFIDIHDGWIFLMSKTTE